MPLGLPSPPRPGTLMTSSEADLLCVVGGESTGKSTLVSALARDLPGLELPETLRSWVEQRGGCPQQASRSRSCQPTPQRRKPPGEAGRLGLRWVVSDGGTLMTAVYSIVYYDDDSLVDEAMTSTAFSRLVVWCAADIPWAADEMRDGPELRSAAQQVIGEVLESSGVPWLRVTGPVGQRVEQVRERLDAAGGTVG